MKEFTQNEIESVGASRYIKEKHHVAQAVLWMVGGLALALLTLTLLESRLSRSVVQVMAGVCSLVGLAGYSKIVIWDAGKAGKKFYAEYMKEKQS